MNKQFLTSVIISLGFILQRAFGLLTVRPSLGAASLPVVPTADNELSLTLKVAKAIKPTETPGSLLDALLGNRDVEANAEVKAVVHFDENYKARVVVLPGNAADAAVFADGEIVQTITRDDPESETSAHTTETPGQHAGELVPALIENLMVASKPTRNLASLVNAIADAAKKAALDLTGFVFVQDTNGNGSLKVYAADLGTLAGKLADATQEGAEPAVPKATRW